MLARLQVPREAFSTIPHAITAAGPPILFRPYRLLAASYWMHDSPQADAAMHSRPLELWYGVPGSDKHSADPAPMQHLAFAHVLTVHEGTTSLHRGPLAKPEWRRKRAVVVSGAGNGTIILLLTRIGAAVHWSTHYRHLT